jgi:aspartate aminotransferase-like enzyme
MPATVELTRNLIGVQIRRGKFDVMVDGTGVASIDAHETIETPVEPGRHTLQLRYGRYSSRTAAFDAAEGQVVAFRCGEKRFLPIFLASFVVPSLAIPLHRD